MKHLFLLGLLFCASFVSAQTVTLVTDSLDHDVESTVTDYKIHCIVGNLNNTPLNLIWQREVVCKTPEWQTYICDDNTCWSPTINTKPILQPLAAGDTTFIDLHIKPNEVAGGAIVKLLVFESGNPTNVAEVLITVNSCVVASNDQKLVVTRLAPNPTNDFVDVLNPPANVGAYQITNRWGQVLLTQQAADGNRLDISKLAGGNIYNVILLDTKGKPLAALNLSKF
jgi:hypothetical protein